MKNKRLLLLPVLLLFVMSIVFPALSAPLEDVDDSYTKALLHFDGSDASTTFTDESGKTWTAAGNAQLDTAQYKFGTASLLLDGNTDYISTADSDDFYFSTGNFTIDLFIKFASFPASNSYRQLVTQKESSNSRWAFNFYGTSSSQYFHFINVTSGETNIGIWKQLTTPMNTGEWYHVAIVRSGNNFQIFLNGTQVSTTATDTDEVGNVSASVIIGGTTAAELDGNIDEFRVSKGVARWTSNFTPPSSQYEPTPTITPSPTNTATNTATFTPTATATNTETPTPTFTPTITDTPTYTPTITDTPVVTSTYTDTPTPSNTPTITPTVPTGTPVTPAYTIVPNITYGDYAVTISVAGLCLVIILIGLIALGLYVGQRERTKR